MVKEALVNPVLNLPGLGGNTVWDELVAEAERFIALVARLKTLSLEAPEREALENQEPIPRTHDVEELARLCEVVRPSLKSAWSKAELAELSDYAVILRCDSEFWPEHGVAEDAVALAVMVRSTVLAAMPLSA